MRRSRRFRRTFRKVNIFVVVFVAFVNACIYSPIHSLAADSVSLSSCMNIAFNGAYLYTASGSGVTQSTSFSTPASSSSSPSSGSSSSTMFFDFYIPIEFRFSMPSDFSEGHISGGCSFDFLFYLSGTGASQNSSLSWVNLDIYSVDAPDGITVGGYPTSYNYDNYTSGKHMWLTVNFDRVNVNSDFRFNVYIHVTASKTYTVNPLGTFYLTTPNFSSSAFVNSGYVVSSSDEGLANGYDSTSGDQVASDFESGAASYDQAEDNLFNSADSALTGFKFFDFSTFGTITTGLSFVSGIMTSIYNNFGAMQGIGIVLSVLFSVMFMAIVIGFYRYFK